MTTPGYLISRGMLLYRDIKFVHTPGLMELLAGTFAVFGVSAETVRMFAMGWPLAAHAALLHETRRFRLRDRFWASAFFSLDALCLARELALADGGDHRAGHSDRERARARPTPGGRAVDRAGDPPEADRGPPPRRDRGSICDAPSRIRHPRRSRLGVTSLRRGSLDLCRIGGGTGVPSLDASDPLSAPRRHRASRDGARSDCRPHGLHADSARSSARTPGGIRRLHALASRGRIRSSAGRLSTLPLSRARRLPSLSRRGRRAILAAPGVSVPRALPCTPRRHHVADRDARADGRRFDGKVVFWNDDPTIATLVAQLRVLPPDTPLLLDIWPSVLPQAGLLPPRRLYVHPWLPYLFRFNDVQATITSQAHSRPTVFVGRYGTRLAGTRVGPYLVEFPLR